MQDQSLDLKREEMEPTATPHGIAGESKQAGRQQDPKASSEKEQLKGDLGQMRRVPPVESCGVVLLKLLLPLLKEQGAEIPRL